MDIKEVKVTVMKGGPAIINGNIRLILPDSEEKTVSGNTAICRCGQSKNAPFCDGSHAKVGFDK